LAKNVLSPIGCTKWTREWQGDGEIAGRRDRKMGRHKIRWGDGETENQMRGKGDEGLGNIKPDGEIRK